VFDRFKEHETKKRLGKQLSKEQSATYQAAFEAVLAVPIAVGFGWWCDTQFESAPIGMLIGVGIGFAAMLLRIVRMRPSEEDVKDYSKLETKLNEDEDEDEDLDKD
jgi:F0F1-type ATP synthase assembly protein I